MQFALEGYEEEVPCSSKLARSVREFYGYIEVNQQFIPNYRVRYGYGETIGTSFVESTVNQVVSKRMVKKQQMRWTKKGAHPLLQVRFSGVERRSLGYLRTVVPIDVKNTRSAAGGSVAPGLKWSQKKAAHLVEIEGRLAQSGEMV